MEERKIKIAIYIMDDGDYDEAYFILEDETDLSCWDYLEENKLDGFIDFEGGYPDDLRMKREKAWMHDEWTDIATWQYSFDEFLKLKPKPY